MATFVAERANAHHASASSYSVTVSGLTTGNLLVAIVAYPLPGSGIQTLASISDNGTGSAWQIDEVMAVSSISGLDGLAIASTIIGSSPPTSITINLGVATSSAYKIAEFAGILHSNWYDVSAPSRAGTSTSVSTSSILPAQAGELIVAAFGSSSPETSFAATGAYSTLGSTLNSTPDIGAAYRLSGLGSSQSASGNFASGSGTSAPAIIVAYKTGTPSNDTRDVRVTGKITSNTSQDVRIKGKATTALSVDSRITGKQLSNTTQDIRVSGKTTSSRTQDARITGKATTNRVQDVRLTGVGHPSSTLGFPTTGILDNFNRTNGALGSSWNSPLFPGESAFTVASNAALGSISTASSYWNTTFAASSQNFVSYGPNADNIFLHIRSINPNSSTFSGYAAQFSQTGGTLRFFRIDNTIYTQIGSTISGLVIFDGDQIGIQMIGGSLTAYKNGVLLGSASDNTYTGGGYIGVEGTGKAGNAAQFDNFGGGSIAVLSDVRVTGFGLSNRSSDARIFGTNLSSVSSDARVKAQANANSSYSTRVTGQSPNSISFNIRITGRATSATSYNVRIPAFANPAPLEELDARVTGSSLSVVTYNIAVGGIAGSFAEYVSSLNGELPSSSDWFVKFIGVQLSAIATDARIVGESSTQVNQSIRATGVSRPIVYIVDIRTRGQAISSTNQSVRIGGKLFSNTSYATKVSAVGKSNTRYDIHIRGKNFSTTTTNVRVKGQLSLSATRSTRLTGQSPQQASYGVRVKGQLPSSSVANVRVSGKKFGIAFVGVRITGKASSSVSYSVRIGGKKLSNTTQLVHITGYLPSSSKTQDARLLGSVPTSSTKTQDIRLVGVRRDNVAYNVMLVGGILANFTEEVRIIGFSNTTVSFNVKIRGANIYMTQDVRIVGFTRINQRRKFKVATKVNKRYDIQTGETTTERSYKL